MQDDVSPGRGDGPQLASYWPDALGMQGTRAADIIAALNFHGHAVMLFETQYVRIEPGWVSAVHRHQHYEADIILKGHAHTITAPAQPVGPGTVIYHPPHRPHAWHAVGTQCCEVLHLQFDVRPAVPLRHPARWPVWPDFFTDTQLLFGEIEEQSPNWSDRFALRLAVIFSRVLSLIEAPDSDAPERAATLRHLAALEEYLQAHLAQPLTLDMIAQHLCISRRTLTRLVRQQTNGSVMDRLRTLRMTRAATLLWQTELSLQEIAEQVGIPQLSNFCRCFRRCYHYSPARYRRQMLKTRASALNLYSFLGRTAIPAKE